MKQKVNRSIRFSEENLRLAKALQIDVNKISNEALEKALAKKALGCPTCGALTPKKKFK